MDLEMLDDWLKNPEETEKDFQEIEIHIGVEFQSQEQLEEAGVEPSKEELTRFSLSEEIDEKQLNEEIEKLESAAE
jgi:hypothetical protein